MTELIIDRPHWQTGRQRLVFGALTLLFWAIWIYIWMPLVALIGWALGVRTAYVQMVELRGYVGLVHVMWIYALVVVLLGGGLLIWAYYNYFRFRGVENRKARPAVDVHDLAAFHHMAPAQFGQWLEAKRLVIHHSAEGALVGAEL